MNLMCKTSNNGSVELYGGFLRTDYCKNVECSWAGACIHLFFRNTTLRPVNVDDVFIANMNAVSLVEQGYLVWFDINPKTILPGGIGLIKLRLKHMSKLFDIDEVKVIFSDEETSWGDAYSLKDIAKIPSLFLSYVSFSESLDEVYFYVRALEPGTVGRLRKIEWEGTDITNQVSSELAVTDRMLFVKVVFSEELKEGSYATVRLTMDNEECVVYQVKVLKPYFPTAMYGAQCLDAFKDYKEHNVDAYVPFTPLSDSLYSDLDKTGLQAIAPVNWESGTGEEVMKVAQLPTFYAFHLMDEPDVKDYHSGRGLGATAPQLLNSVDFVRRYGQGKPSILAIDNTFRPGNFWVYSEIADINVGHFYPIEGGDFYNKEYSQAKGTRLVSLVSSPRPTYSIAQFFGRKRLPVPEEMYLQVLIALANGAKGISYYVHSGGGGLRGGSDQKLWDYVGDLNKMLSFLMPLVAISDWGGEGKACTDEVQVDYLLCADKGILAFAINKDTSTQPERFTYDPKRNIELSIALPDVVVKNVSILKGQKFVSFDRWEVKDRKLCIQIENLDLGEVFFASF